MKRDHAYIIVIIVLIVLFLIHDCNQKKSHKSELQATTRSATSLLQDTLEKTEKRKDAYWSVIISEIAPKDVDEDMIAELNYNQQLLLIELAKYKNLVASFQTKYTGNKTDTVTMFVRIPVLHPFSLSWLDTIGGYTYLDTVYVDSNQVRRVHLPKLQFTHDVRITKNRKGEVSGEIRVKGLEEFDLVAQNVYQFYSPSSPADIRKRKWKKIGIWTGIALSNGLMFYAGTKMN